MILAGIDIGTNTIRLLVAETGDTAFRELYSGRSITRLGQDLDRTGVLAEDAQERTLAALAAFSEVLREYTVSAVAAVGTSALRRAANAGDFIAAVERDTGIAISVIEGAEEARLTVTGVRKALSGRTVPAGDPLDSALVVDIGGGSTELIGTRNGAAVAVSSLPLGAVYLTERLLPGDPPSRAEQDLLRDAVRRELDEWERGVLLQSRMGPQDFDVLAGTAGTITTLAAMDLGLAFYDPARINGHVFSRTFLDDIVSRLASLSLRDRRTLAGLERGREDIIYAGAVIIREIMSRCGRTELLVSDWGLREGIIFDLYARRHRDATAS